jgi:NTP pyrophosphatase (non-canonical NTP hydrolase)
MSEESATNDDVVREHQRVMSTLMVRGGLERQLAYNGLKAGEELGEVQKHITGHILRGTVDISGVSEELGDLYGCMTAVAESLGLDMLEIIDFHRRKVLGKRNLRAYIEMGGCGGTEAQRRMSMFCKTLNIAHIPPPELFSTYDRWWAGVQAAWK